MKAGLRLKHVAKVDAGQSPPSPDVVPFDGEGMPFLQGNAEFGGQYPAAVHRCDSAPRIAEAGALLVSVRAPVGAVNIADQQYGIGRGLAAISPRAIHERYAYWLLLSSAGWLNSIATGSTFTAISGRDLGDVSVPVTNEHEQRAIADYLDRETAQIDAFIAKNEELIILLTERRTVAVDRAIGWGSTSREAKGDWLGRVPAGWSLAPLRRWTRFITSGSRGWGQFYSDAGSDIFLRIGDLQRDRLELRPVERQRVELPVGEEGVRARTQTGDLLISITADLGSVAVIEAPDAGAYVSQHVALVRLDQERLNSRFGAYVVASSAGKTHFEKAAYGGTKVQLSLPDVREMSIAVPPLDEQVRIVKHLDAVTDDVDTAIETARKAIVLAGERRAALISAAVTGKIDVGVAA